MISGTVEAMNLEQTIIQRNDLIFRFGYYAKEDPELFEQLKDQMMKDIQELNRAIARLMIPKEQSGTL